MKNIKVFAIVLTVLAMAFVLYAEGMGSMKCGGMKGMDMKGCGMKPGACGMMDMSNCPFCIKGAEVKVVNTADGIQITVVSKDKAVAKEIQEKGAKFSAVCADMDKHADMSSAVKNTAVTETTLDGSPDDTVTCPVTGETFKKKDAFKVYEYKGKKYYMCCGMCVKPFTTNPEKYVK
jgi:YHS domain-containing protein